MATFLGTVGSADGQADTRTDMVTEMTFEERLVERLCHVEKRAHGLLDVLHPALAGLYQLEEGMFSECAALPDPGIPDNPGRGPGLLNQLMRQLDEIDRLLGRAQYLAGSIHQQQAALKQRILMPPPPTLTVADGLAERACFKA